MYAFELLPQLKFLTLTVNNDAEYWEERLEFIGTHDQFNQAYELEKKLCSE